MGPEHSVAVIQRITGQDFADRIKHLASSRMDQRGSGRRGALAREQFGHRGGCF